MRSASSPNGGGKNMIRIDDAAGSERMDVHAEKDQRIVVEADEQRDVGEDRSREVAGKETVRVGGDITLMVGGDYDVSVGGDSSTTVGKNRTVWVGLGDTVSTAGDHSLSIGSAHLRRIGRDDTVEAAGLDERIGAVHCELALRNVSLSSKKTVTSIVGGASVGIARGGHKSTTKLARAEAVGAIALSKSAGDTSIEVGKTHDVKVGGVMSVTAGTAAGIEATGLELDAIGPFLLEGAKSVTLEVGENGVVLAEGTILVYGKKLIIDGESKLAFAEATIE
jgi:type VI secretion system secreted protein VgrG